MIIITSDTTIYPIQTIGKYAGTCWGSDTSDPEKNIARAIDCIEHGHGRVSEFGDVYMTIEGYSARVMRELYTHIGGAPTRLQESTRYVKYDGFDYVKRDCDDNELVAVFDACHTPCHEVQDDKFYYCVMAHTVANNLHFDVGKDDYFLLSA